MLPSILAHQIQDGVADFIRSTFPAANPFFAGMLDRFLVEPGTLFKGPYHSLKLPFRPGSAGTDVLRGLKLRFPPYLHQQRAFDRLRGPTPKSTLVAIFPPQPCDPDEAEDVNLRERCLIHVAATRARRSVLVTSNGRPTTLCPNMS